MNPLTEKSDRIRTARKLTRRAGRDKAGLFLAEGVQAVREALTYRANDVVEVFIAESAPDSSLESALDGLVVLADSHSVPVREGTSKALASLSETVTPQGIVAVCRPVTVPLATALGERSQLVSVLVDARDPGNAGTVIRCSDAAGADAVVLTAGSVDPQGGKAVRASVGSLFHLPVTTGADVSDVVAVVKAHGMTVIAADGTGDIDLHRAGDVLSGPVAWLFGNEASGLPDDALALADHVIRVPIYGRAESLNLATAAAVCLYESARALNL